MASIPNVQASSWPPGSRAIAPSSNSVRIGEWSCDELISEGVRHRVYAARPHQRPYGWPLDYVVKVLRRQMQTNRLMVESLRREAVIGTQFNHAHLVPVISAQITEPPYYVVYPRLAGMVLSDWLRRDNTLSTTFALWIARQTCEALQGLHQAGWLHGDVKSDNILVSPDGHVTLVDLGAAERAGSPVHITEMPFLSTLHYAAPERFGSRLATDIRSEIYSVGVVLFECLTGTVPFDGPTTAAVIDAHRRKPAPDLRRVKPGLFPAVVDLVRCMLAKDPLRRPHSTEELIRRLIVLEIDTLPDHVA